MKITRFLLLSAVLFFAFSCSDDDEPTKSQEDQEKELEETSLSLAGSANVVSVPSAMLNSDDTYAQMAAAWVQQANAMSTYLNYTQIPQGATKTSKITASNGRSNANDAVLTYTWTDGQGGSIAYQISNTADKNVFELFLKSSGSTGWLKYFHAEEMKDKSKGYMKVYDIFGFTENPGNALLQYSWVRKGDDFNLIIDDYSGEFVIEMNVNLKTKAGDVLYIIEGNKRYEITWDAKGNGTWTWYDEDGSVVLDSDSWTV